MCSLNDLRKGASRGTREGAEWVGDIGIKVSVEVDEEAELEGNSIGDVGEEEGRREEKEGGEEKDGLRWESLGMGELG